MNPRPSGQPLEHGARLAVLEASGLMDSPAEESFDRYTRLVRLITGSDISLVSLVDDHRQFFKSADGLGGQLRETPLSHSFCQIVVRTGEPLRIEDAKQDDRVCDNLAVSELGVISYLGIPIRTGSGLVLGSLCAIGLKPRHWTDHDVTVLRDLADAVASEIRLRLLARSLQSRLQEEQVREQARQESLRILVHDLRTPIGSLISCIDLVDDNDPASRSSVISLMRSTGAQALHMVEGLLADSTLVEAAARLSAVDAGTALHGAVEMIRPLADAAGQSVEMEVPDSPAFCLANPSLLQRILMNLLTNATKHCPSGTRVTCSASCHASLVSLEVADNGPGIPDSAKARIFHISETAGSAGLLSGKLSSYGLGLDFCRRAAEAMGGSISVGDTPGGGATFTVRLAATAPQS